jgi:hypothetical protein
VIEAMGTDAFSDAQRTAAAGAPTNCFDDIAGDLNDDGLDNAADTTIRRHICYAAAQGWAFGTGGGDFDPHDTVQRKQVASFYARFLGYAGNAPLPTQYDDVGPVAGFPHVCNIARGSDLDADGTYGNGAFVIQGYEPLVSSFGPDDPINNNQAHLMASRAGAITDDNISDDLRDEYPCQSDGPVATEAVLLR